MSKKGFRFLAVTTVCTPLVLEIIRAFVRPIYGRKEYGALAEFLGWLPNFLAGFGFVLSGTLFVALFLELTKKRIAKKFLFLGVFIIGVFSFAGLSLHEIAQTGMGLYYDVNDIYATAGGTLTGFLAAFVFLKNYETDDLSS